VLASRIKRRVKLHGQRLIVSDLRAHDMAKRAHIFLRPEPSTDLVWINAVARYIIDQGWEDKEFIASRVNDYDKYRTSLDRYTSLEKEGTFVNTERRIQRLYQALPSLGQSRPDWVILRDLAARLGHDWGYQNPSQITD